MNALDDLSGNIVPDFIAEDKTEVAGLVACFLGPQEPNNVGPSVHFRNRFLRTRLFSLKSWRELGFGEDGAFAWTAGDILIVIESLGGGLQGSVRIMLEKGKPKLIADKARAHG